MMRLDLYKLKLFITVAQEGSFSRAAERTYMTQSAISQHMHELEVRLGVLLFVRGHRGVTLTPEGATLHEYALRILALVAEAENAVADIDNLETGEVRIGATPGVGVYLLPDWARDFRERYPRLSVNIQTGVTPQIVQDTLAYRLDFGLIEGELDARAYARLRVLVLQSVEQWVAVGRGHPWWGRASVPIQQLNGQAIITRPRNSQSRAWLEQTLNGHAINPVIGAEFDNLESTKRYLASGEMLAILPEYVVKQEQSLGLIHAVRVDLGDDRRLTRDLKLICVKGASFSPVARGFVSYLVTLYPHLADALG